MGALTSMLDEARQGDPDELTEAERIERGIYESLRDQRMVPSGVPPIALKALLWERLRSKTSPDKQDMYLGNWLIEVDQSRETLELVAKWFKGTSLEAAVDVILG